MGTVELHDSEALPPHGTDICIIRSMDRLAGEYTTSDVGHWFYNGSAISGNETLVLLPDGNARLHATLLFEWYDHRAEGYGEDPYCQQEGSREASGTWEVCDWEESPGEEIKNGGVTFQWVNANNVCNFELEIGRYLPKSLRKLQDDGEV